jgi:hypothetical protein
MSKKAITAGILVAIALNYHLKEVMRAHAYGFNDGWAQGKKWAKKNEED